MKIERLAFENVCFRYEGAKTIFQDLSIEMPLNESVWVTGESGTGRSTLLKMMAALLTPHSGSLYINDFNVAEMSFEEFLPVRKQIGYTFDFGGLLANRTLFDNLMLPLLYHNEVAFAEAERRVQILMEIFGLLEHKEHRPANVSGSMRKACVVARAFVMNPAILLLDEPFVALDREQCMRLLELIRLHLQQGSLQHIFFTSRDEDLAKKFATSRIHISDQKIARQPFISENYGSRREAV